MKSIYITTLSIIIGTSSFFAPSVGGASLIAGPTVSAVTATSATVSIDPVVLGAIPEADRAGIYFEYTETQKVCIMIYPTPVECLPKKTAQGQSTVTITGLTPNTSYTVWYKKDNTIACITTPCPRNGLESAQMTFTTQAQGTSFSRNLAFRSRGSDVVLLQDTLRARGYFTSQSTGYFGVITLRAVKAYQKNYMKIPPTGFVGPLTRLSLSTAVSTTDETFEGTISAVSTACFADGECSVTIDGKKVVTTIGWSRDIVGSIKGTALSIGDIETNKIGARAKVYAKKTADGYTLYGNANYYIDVQ